MHTGNKSTGRRAVEFAAVGGSISVFSFVQLWLYIDVFGLNYWTAYAIQTFISVEANYWGNYLLAWSDRKSEINLVRSHLTFWATRIVMIFVNFGAFAVLTAFDVNYLFAQVLIIGSNTVINYFIGDKLVFKNQPHALGGSNVTTVRQRHRTGEEPARSDA